MFASSETDDVSPKKYHIAGKVNTVADAVIASTVSSRESKMREKPLSLVTW